VYAKIGIWSEEIAVVALICIASTTVSLIVSLIDFPVGYEEQE